MTKKHESDHKNIQTKSRCKTDIEEEEEWYMVGKWSLQNLMPINMS